MVDDCAFRLGGLSCEASNFVMASLGILVCFLAALIVFTGIGLLVHFLVLWFNRRRSRDVDGRSDLDRLRASLASVFGPRLPGHASEAPLAPRNSRVWSDLNLLSDRGPPPSYQEALAMVDLAGHVDGSGVHLPDHAEESNGLPPGHTDEPDPSHEEALAIVDLAGHVDGSGVHLPDHAEELNGLPPGHTDEPDPADEPSGLIFGHADQPGDENGEEVYQISRGVWV